MFEERVGQYGVIPPNEEPGGGSQGSEAGLPPIPRRSVLAGIAALALAGPVGLAEAQHVHAAAAADTKVTGGIYKPKALTQHEFDSLRKLSEIIVPGATKGGTAEFVDLLSSQNPEMLAIFTGGLGWLDIEMKRTCNATFLAAKPEQQTAMLDKIAYKKNETPELAAGIRFFVWARRLAVDAYYTSPAGIKELGYLGNKGQKEFTVPQEAIDYAVKRSGLG
jgi:gluconate 2-dehydrogenase gamma chain